MRLVVLGGVSVLLLIAAVSISGAHNVFDRLITFSPKSLTVILILLIANLFLVSFRLWRILRHFGMPLAWNLAFRASISGHMAGLLVMSLFGQVLGRQAILHKYGIQGVTIASVTAYERGLVGLISGGLGLCGATLLIGSTAVADFLIRIPFAEIAIVIMGGVSLSLWLGRSRFEKRLASHLWSRTAFFCLLEIAGVTLISQCIMVGSFVAGIEAIHPGVDKISLFAAGAVISFAASIPVTVNGWGIRELTTVYVLRELGISAPDAVTGSVLVGLCSTIVIVALSLFVLKKPIRGAYGFGPFAMIETPAYEVEKGSAWILAMATAVLVFFQFHAELPGSLGVINLNMADPFAILALAAVTIQALAVRRLPRWRVQSFNVILGLISMLLLMSFFRGVLEIGVTQWALAGRVFGWVILLGYISIGYVLVSHAGEHGLRRFCETVIATGVVIVVLQIILRFLVHSGLIQNISLNPNFQGYAANRNAFVFQMLVCISLLLAYSSVRHRIGSTDLFVTPLSNVWLKPSASYWFPALLGILLLGVILSGSRSGVVVGAVVLLFAWLGRFAEQRIIAWGVFFTIIFWSLILLNSMILGETIQSPLSTGSSDQEHLESILRAVDLWLQSPVLGRGLGVFIEKSTDWFGHPVVIHNTPVWILTEFGLIGAAIFGWGFVRFVSSVSKLHKIKPAVRILKLVLLVFALFCLTHEIFYQRMLWLAIGAALAVRLKSHGSGAESKAQRKTISLGHQSSASRPMIPA